LALIAGSLYISSVAIASFLRSILQASNYFKGVFYNEIVFQTVRLIIIPLFILLSLKHLFSNEILLFFIIFGLGISYLASLFFSWFLHRNKFKYLTKKGEKINSLERGKVNRFIIPAAATVITTIFFGSVDMVMLGRFVLSEFIGYYRALISFSIVLLPVFSRLRKQQLETGFRKSISITFLCSLILFFFVFLFSPLLIHIIYGNLYESSINLLRVFSPLLISTPILSVYISYFAAKGKPFIVTKMLIYSLIINIILNILAILLFRNYGDLFVVYGVTGATIISNWFYMIGLIISKKKQGI
jgi:O-antigen/teichoic acid export membrane protein